MLAQEYKWESGLWPLIGGGNGDVCPVHNACQRAKQCAWSKVDSLEFKKIQRFLENDKVDLIGYDLSELDFLKKQEFCIILKLVENLVQSFLEKTNIYNPPVPLSIISLADTNRSLDIYPVPLRHYRGAIWRLSDRWVIQLKESDTPARQRFTAFHELFHVLAHCSTTPVFKKKGSKDGSFNEMLADHFALYTLLPRKWVNKQWNFEQDIDRIAEVFQAPVRLAWFRLRLMDLL